MFKEKHWRSVKYSWRNTFIYESSSCSASDFGESNFSSGTGASNSNVRKTDLFIKQVPLGREKGQQGLLPVGVRDFVSRRREVPNCLGREYIPDPT